MRIPITLMVVILMTTIAVHTAYTATFSSPVEGAVVKTGEQYLVRLELDSSEQVKEVVFVTWKPGQTAEIKTPPYETYFTSDKELGESSVEASITFVDGKLMELSRNIKIVLVDGVKLQNITYLNKDESFSDTDKEKTLKSFYGTYSDGIERDLPNIADPVLEYSSDDPSIVVVDNAGKAMSKGLGETFITIKSRDISFKLPVWVIAELEPARNLKLQPTQTDIQLTWDISPSDPKWVTEYKIYRSESSDGLMEDVIALLPKGSTTFTDKTVKAGKTYYYSVQAISSTAKDVSNMTGWQSCKLQ